MHYQASHRAEVICFVGLVFGLVIWSKAALMNKHKIEWRSTREPSLDNQNLSLFARCDVPRTTAWPLALPSQIPKGLNNSNFYSLVLASMNLCARGDPETLWLHTLRWGKRYRSKPLHPQPVLSIATPSYPEWFNMPISRSVCFFFPSWWLPLKEPCRRTCCSSPQHHCPLGRWPDCGCSPRDWAHTDFELHHLHGPVSNSASQECLHMRPENTAFTRLCADKSPSYEYARKQDPREVAGQIH